MRWTTGSREKTKLTSNTEMSSHVQMALLYPYTETPLPLPHTHTLPPQLPPRAQQMCRAWQERQKWLSRCESCYRRWMARGEARGQPWTLDAIEGNRSLTWGRHLPTGCYRKFMSKLFSLLFTLNTFYYDLI